MLDTAAVIALAPDSSSAKAGQGLASTRHWKELGRSGEALWGLCQGSGKDPYQTRVALADYTTSCSCPSRKFPCKHALGLLLLAAQGQLPPGEPPPFAAEWLAKRAEKAERKAEKETTPRTPEQEAKAAAAAEKRVESRTARRAEGLADLSQWMADLVRTGLGSAPVTEASFWENRAKRLVDAQLPALGRRLQRCYSHAIRRSDWPEAVLREFGMLTLAIEAQARAEALSPEARADLERALGSTQGADALDEASAVEDDCLCLAVVAEELETVTMQRAWWWAASVRRLALVLAFTPNGQPLKTVGVPGQSARLRLAWFPGAWPLRAQVLGQTTSAMRIEPPATTIAEALDRYAHALGADPWQESLMLVIAGRLHLVDDQLWLCDAAGDALPLGTVDTAGWRWLAHTRGAPARWSGEWNGENFQLLHGWPA